MATSAPSAPRTAAMRPPSALLFPLALLATLLVLMGGHGARGGLIMGGTFDAVNGVPHLQTVVQQLPDGAWQDFLYGPYYGTFVTSTLDALIVYKGTLYAGYGCFYGASSTLPQGLSYWTGTTWVKLPISRGVCALYELNGQLLIGGSFTSAGGVPVGGVAEYDGTSFSAYGTGTNMDTGVCVIAEYNGGTVFGGTFTTIGNVGASGIATWTGTEWNTMAGGVGGSVYGLAVYNGKLYVTGQFFNIGSTRANGIAAYDGAWTTFGTGLLILENVAGSGASLCVFQGNLYLTGNFGSVNGTSTNGLAAFTGNSWYAPASTATGTTDKMAVSTDGSKLYVTYTLGLNNGVATFNGTSVIKMDQVSFRGTPGGDPPGSLYYYNGTVGVSEGALLFPSVMPLLVATLVCVAMIAFV